MGHERIGMLPTTEKWRDIVDQIAGMYVSEAAVAEIARQTIQNVRNQFRRLDQDGGVLESFQFLVNLAVASREENPRAWLSSIGIELPEDPTPISFAKAVNAWIELKRDSYEYGEIAQRAAGDAISGWYNENKPTTGSLFESLEDPFEVWRRAGNAAGFCELSRLFFAKLTQRYLEYFLDREASSALGDIEERTEFKRQLENHVDSISVHAFETAKITQSFAAGRFNKHPKEGVPSQKEIKEFLNIALGKMRDGLQQEDNEE